MRISNNESVCFLIADADELQQKTEAIALSVLGDSLVFLRRIALSVKVKLQLCGAKWTSLLLQIASNKLVSGGCICAIGGVSAVLE